MPREAQAQSAAKNEITCIICNSPVYNSNTETKKHVGGFMHKQYRTFAEKYLAKKPEDAAPDASDLEVPGKGHQNHACLLCEKEWTKSNNQTKCTPIMHLTQNADHKIKVENLWKGLQRRLSAARMNKRWVPMDGDVFYTPLSRRST